MAANTSTVYIDWEGVWPDLVEVGLAVVENGTVTQLLCHVINTNTIQDPKKHNQSARYSHCISHKVVQTEGIALEGIQLRFLTCLDQCTYPITIRGFGSDTSRDSLCKVFPFLSTYDCTYSQADLPNWSIRTRQVYHKKKIGLKQSNALAPICPASNHALTNTVPAKKTRNNTVLAKLRHDYHYAFYDVLELVFLDYPETMLSFI